MPRYILKVAGLYGEWSSVVDAPVTHLVPLDEFLAYYEAEYGRSSMENLAERLARVEAKGTSSPLHDSAEDHMRVNCYGPEDSELSVEDVKEKWLRGSAQWREDEAAREP